MLSINIPTILFQIFNFLVLTVALYFLLFRKVVRNIQKRSREKDELLKDAEQKQAEAQKVLEEYEQKLSRANTEVSGIITNAKQEIEDERLAAVSDLELEANRILGEAQAEVEHRQKLAMEKYYDKVIDQVMETSKVVISKSIPPGLHAELIRQTADEIWRLGREELDRVASIRKSLRDRTPLVHVSTAKALDAEQQGLLVRTFSALADRNIKLEIEVKPELGAGVLVRIGDLVVDNTVATQVDKLRDQASEDLHKKLVK
jgi:F-type H+-transporting ATPase subunit b